MERQALSFILFAAGLANFLSCDFTGRVIGGSSSYSNTLSFFIGVAFLSASFLVLITSRNLEAIVIPTGTREADRERTTRAMLDYKPGEYVLVSGVIGRDESGRVERNTQQYNIYKDLRETYHLAPKDMIIEGKSKDTLENFMYMLKKVNGKGINRLKIATDTWQFKRFQLYVDQAKKEGLVEDDFGIELLDTGVVRPSLMYGVTAYLKEKGKLYDAGSLENAEKLGRGSRAERLKWILKGLVR